MMPDVIAEHFACNKTARGDRNRAGDALLAQPVEEIVGPVVQRAHLRGRHVQNMVQIAGGMGEPVPEARPSLYQLYAARVRTSPHQLEGEQLGVEDKRGGRRRLVRRRNAGEGGQITAVGALIKPFRIACGATLRRSLHADLDEAVAADGVTRSLTCKAAWRDAG